MANSVLNDFWRKDHKTLPKEDEFAQEALLFSRLTVNTLTINDIGQVIFIAAGIFAKYDKEEDKASASYITFKNSWRKHLQDKCLSSLRAKYDDIHKTTPEAIFYNLSLIDMDIHRNNSDLMSIVLYELLESFQKKLKKVRHKV